jgi:hypothetical protein
LSFPITGMNKHKKPGLCKFHFPPASGSSAKGWNMDPRPVHRSKARAGRETGRRGDKTVFLLPLGLFLSVSAVNGTIHEGVKYHENI